MKILIVGDTHFKAVNSLEVDAFVSALLDKCRAIHPELIVLLGDTLNDHERLHIIPLNKAVRMIGMLSAIAPTFVLVGNHDLVNNQQFLNDMHWLNCLKDRRWCTVIDRYSILHTEKCHFAFVPYVPPGRFHEALATAPTIYRMGGQEVKKVDAELAESWKDAQVIFAHQEFQGCKLGSVTSTTGDIWNLEDPLIISGHIHSRQQPQRNIIYPGSARQVAFSEAVEAAVSIAIFTSEGLASLEHIPLGLIKKKIVYLEISSFEDYEVGSHPEAVKLSIEGTRDEFKLLRKSKKFQQLQEKGCKIVCKPRIEEEDLSLATTSDFLAILSKLVQDDGSLKLREVFEEVTK